MGVSVIVGEEVADGDATVDEAGFVSTAGAVIVAVNTGCFDGWFVGVLVIAWQAVSAKANVIIIIEKCFLTIEPIE